MKAESLKISVILPVYNPGEYLAPCLDSILRQTLRDIEIVCVDDGSTDNSLRTLKAYAAKDARIRVFSQPNGGAAKARNNGLDHARGEFVAFMDPDDLYPDERVLQDLYENAVSHGANVCGGCMMQFFPDGRKVDSYVGINAGYSFKEEGFVDYVDYQFEYGYTRFIYSRALIEERKIRFPDYLRFQDPPFFVLVMLTAGRFYALPRLTYSYRATNQAKKVDWEGYDYRRLRDFAKGMTTVAALALENNMPSMADRMLTRFLRGAGMIFFSPKYFGHVRSELDALAAVLERAPYVEYMRKQPPLVSVVIPIYDVQRYLPECLASVMAQRLRELEIICIDDGSPDDSAAVVSYYARLDPRIRVFSQKNGGLSAARNSGMSLAKGRYIYFLDSDDKLRPESLAELYKLAERERLDQVIFSSEVFLDAGSEASDNLKRQAGNFKNYYQLPAELCDKVMSGDEFFIRSMRANKFFASQPLRFYRLQPLREAGCHFPNGLLHEDNYFAPVALHFSKRIVAVDRKYYLRRVRSDSIMTQRADLSPRLHGLLGVIMLLCNEDKLWDGGAEHAEMLSIFLQDLLRALSWQCRDTPQDRWGDALDGIVGVEHPIIKRFLLRCLIPTLKDTACLSGKVAALKRELERAKNAKPTIPAKAQHTEQMQAPNRRVAMLEKEIVSLKHSEAYRVGMVVTWPARKAWGGIKCLRENGVKYTAKHLVGKVARTLGFRSVKW